MNTLNDQVDKQTAIAPIKSDLPLAKVFPIGVPVVVPEGNEEPTLSVNGEEFYEIPLDFLGDLALLKVAEFYMSDRCPPLLHGSYAIRHLALVPASWIGVAA